MFSEEKVSFCYWIHALSARSWIGKDFCSCNFAVFANLFQRLLPLLKPVEAVGKQALSIEASIARNLVQGRGLKELDIEDSKEATSNLLMQASSVLKIKKVLAWV